MLILWQVVCTCATPKKVPICKRNSKIQRILWNISKSESALWSKGKTKSACMCVLVSRAPFCCHVLGWWTNSASLSSCFRTKYKIKSIMMMMMIWVFNICGHLLDKIVELKTYKNGIFSNKFAKITFFDIFKNQVTCTNNLCANSFSPSLS